MSDHRLTRRDFLRMSAAGSAFAFLAACQPAMPANAPASSGSGAQAPAKQALKVLDRGHAFEPRVALDKVYIGQFMEKNPEITVDQETPGDYDTMLPTALAAGTAGDLFAHSNRFMVEYYRQGTIMPVQFEAFNMQQADLLGLYIEPNNTLGGGMFEGKLYGIPNEVSIYALHINNKLFTDGGFDPAKDYPKNWQQFTDIAEKLTKRDAGGQLVQRGAQLGWKTAGICDNIFGGQLYQLGGSEVTADKKKSAINSPEATKVLNFWKYFSDKGSGQPQVSTRSEPVFTGQYCHVDEHRFVATAGAARCQDRLYGLSCPPL